MRDYTDITLILDESGSMQSLISATVEGYNEFLKSQRGLCEQDRFSLLKFSGMGIPKLSNGADLYRLDDVAKIALSRVGWLCQAIPLSNAPLMTAEGAAPKMGEYVFKPSGSTPLLDAIAFAIISNGVRFEAMPEGERPQRVVVVIITDGEENSSVSFSRYERGYERIAEMIQHQKDVYNWTFVFLAANQDAIASASRISITPDAAINYLPVADSAQAAYRVASAAVLRVRSGEAASFTEEERARLVKQGNSSMTSSST